MRRFALIPAYKPNENLIYFVQSLEKRGIEVVVVDDGSGGCREMTAIRKGGMTHFESHHPKFLHKKRWLTTTIFFSYML